jgi:DNA-binding phage protein
MQTSRENTTIETTDEGYEVSQDSTRTYPTLLAVAQDAKEFILTPEQLATANPEEEGLWHALSVEILECCAELEKRVAGMGRECAAETIDAGGSDPTDEAGNVILPSSPQEEDWLWLAGEMEHEPSREHMQIFSTAYCEVMQAEIDRLEVVHHIKQAIADAGLSQSEVARQCGWDRRALDQRLKVKSPSLETLRKIAGVIGVTVSTLIGE